MALCALSSQLHASDRIAIPNLLVWFHLYLSCSANLAIFPSYRRSNSHKAWSQGTNPITQRSTHSSSNGNMAQKQSGSPRPGQKESNTADNHAHDRLVFLFATFIVRSFQSALSKPLTQPTLFSRVCQPRLLQRMETSIPAFSLPPALRRAIRLSC